MKIDLALPVMLVFSIAAPALADDSAYCKAEYDIARKGNPQADPGIQTGTKILSAQSGPLCQGGRVIGHWQKGTWHLLGVTYGGSLTLLDGLTRDYCEKTRDIMKSSHKGAGLPIWVGEKVETAWPIDEADFRTVECFQ